MVQRGLTISSSEAKHVIISEAGEEVRFTSFQRYGYSTEGVNYNKFGTIWNQSKT
jgi:hypothetical protein